MEEELCKLEASWIEGLIEKMEFPVANWSLIWSSLGTFHNNMMDEPEILTRHHLLINKDKMILNS